MERFRAVGRRGVAECVSTIGGWIRRYVALKCMEALLARECGDRRGGGVVGTLVTVC